MKRDLVENSLEKTQVIQTPANNIGEGKGKDNIWEIKKRREEKTIEVIK